MAMIYIVLILWILVSSVMCFGRKFDTQKNRVIFMVFVFGFMGILMGIRGLSVGVDTEHYKSFYDIVSDMKFLDIVSNYYVASLEVGYAAFMKMCSVVLDNYFFFQIIHGFIFAGLSAKFLLDNSENIFISTIVFLGIGAYATAFNISRQMLAVILVANSWTYLKRRENFKAIIFVFLAAAIHVSAVIFFAAHLIYYFRNNKAIIRLIPIAIIICAVKYKQLIEFFSPFASVYRNYFRNESVIQTAGKVWIVWIIVLLIAFWTIYVSQMKNQEYLFVAIFSMIWVVCNIIGLSFNYFERLGLYFIPFVPVMFSYSKDYIKDTIVRYLYMFFMNASFIAYFLISVLTSKQYVYIPFWK